MGIRNCTGPKTEEGKKRSSMNALKTGQFMKNFQRLDEQAGHLSICKNCGAEQQADCSAVKSCLLQDELILAYHKAHADKNLDHIEGINMVQMASMDMIFSTKLRWALENMGKTETVTGSKGEKIPVPIVKTEDLYALMNMMRALSKTLPDMQLTRQTQENIDLEWAALLQADLTAEKAEANMRQILTNMEKFRLRSLEAQEIRKLDQTIQDHVNGNGENQKSEVVEVKALGMSPFAPNDQES